MSDIPSNTPVSRSASAASIPGTTFRRLAVSEALPNNALLVSPGMDAALADRLTGVLLGMSDTPEGRQTLEQFGAVRFLPCESGEYQAVYNMAERLGPGWGMIGVRPTAPAVAEVEPDKTD